MTKIKRLASCLYYHLIGALLFTACFAIVVIVILIINGLPQDDPLGVGAMAMILLFLPVSFVIILPFLPITYRMGDLTEDGK